MYTHLIVLNINTLRTEIFISGILDCTEYKRLVYVNVLQLCSPTLIQGKIKKESMDILPFDQHFTFCYFSYEKKNIPIRRFLNCRFTYHCNSQITVSQIAASNIASLSQFPNHRKHDISHTTIATWRLYHNSNIFVNKME